MRKLINIICLVLTTLTYNLALAYESDTHLRLMYHLGRATGFNDEVSKFMAIGNQHIDMNAMSSPMLFSAQRHLFHFPGELDAVNVEGHGAISLYAQLMGESKLALATRNHPLGNYFIYQGLQKGDLMAISLGLHIKMDTYGHAGFSNLLGHMDRGHNPDRAFLEPRKYEDMIRSVVQSLVQIRQVMPEQAQDTAATLKYLNNYAKRTYIQRDLTAADLTNPQLVAEVILADEEFQRIFREDVYKKFEYKKIALEKIYKKFRADGTLNNKVKFDELFPRELLNNLSLDATETIKIVIRTNTDSEFLKASTGQDIFNLRKLFGFQNEEIFHQKFNVEKERAETRLRQLFHMLNLEATGQPMSKEMKERMFQEKEMLLGDIYIEGNFETVPERLIKERAVELAEERIAEEIAFKLTKDLIPVDPRKYNEYAKQNFEGETDNRQFENRYKDELYRMKFVKEWGVNWVLESKTTLVKRMFEAIEKFRKFILGIKTPEISHQWETLAAKAAHEFMNNEATREFAQVIGFNNKNKRDAFFKLARYVMPALIPIYGTYYIKSIIKKAKAHAKDHEVENMKEAAEKGKYAKDILASSKTAAENIEQLRRGTKVQCSYYFQ